MSSVYGKAAVAGLTGTITWTSIGTGASPLQTSRNIGHAWNVAAQVRSSSTGEVIGEMIVDERLEGTIEFIPAGGASGDNTLAKAALAGVHPAINAVVTISGSTITDLNTTYNYIGGWSVTETPDGYVKISLQVRKYIAAESAPSVLAATAT